MEIYGVCTKDFRDWGANKGLRTRVELEQGLFRKKKKKNHCRRQE